ncbi:MAG: agmatinase [Caldiserica bacterium]|nr:agmatinase [Caldisericota bacterium]
MKPYSKFTFLSATSTAEESRVVITGFPYELTTSIPGTVLAPNKIREASWLIESYSPYQKKNLESIPISDLANLPLSPLEKEEEILSRVENHMLPLLNMRKKIITIGGDHSITYFVVKNLPAGIRILHLDAHLDSRNSWKGSLLNHATVMRRLKESGREIIPVGIRSVAVEEKEISFFPMEKKLPLKEEDKVYLSIDMDVFDPSIAPAVSNPEPGGIYFPEFLKWLNRLPPFELIGFDIVELNPLLEGAHITSVLGATVIREIILKFWSGKEAST